MYLDGDDLRPCKNCGAPCNGDCCDAFCADALSQPKIEADADGYRPDPDEGTSQWMRRNL